MDEKALETACRAYMHSELAETAGEVCSNIIKAYLAAAPGEYGGLIAQLRDDADAAQHSGHIHQHFLCRAAADAIATLSARLAAAEARAEELEQVAKRDATLHMEAHATEVQWGQHYMAKADHYQAREAKLREALEWALAEIDGLTRYDAKEQRENCLARALAALAVSAQGGEK